MKASSQSSEISTVESATPFESPMNYRQQSDLLLEMDAVCSASQSVLRLNFSGGDCELPALGFEFSGDCAAYEFSDADADFEVP